VNISSLSRMLLSHNFLSSEEIIPKLSRGEFANLFKEGLTAIVGLQCNPMPESSPHWLVEILFPDQLTPVQVGELLAKVLSEKRKVHRLREDQPLPDTLVLGGIKSTPPTSSTGLQPGEWGVDVVEIASGSVFLEMIAWEKTVLERPEGATFKIEILGNS
jgi:hypothetical protein